MRKKSKSAFSIIEISIVLLIIGTIVLTITSSQLLIDKARLKTARSLTQNSPVNAIGGAVLWLEPTLEKAFQNSNDSYLVEDGDSIENWYDTNPGGVNFTATESTDMPTYKTKGIGGLPTLFFDANSGGTSGDLLTVSYEDIFNTDTFTLFVVTQALEKTSNWGMVVSSRDTYFGYNLYKDNSNAEWEFWTGNSSSWDATKSGNLNFNKPTMFTLYRSSIDSTLYLDGSLQNTSSVSYAVNPSKNFVIGRESSTSTLFYDGYVSEIIYFDRALSSTERTSVENYLSKKYKIPLS
jgi:type II secretory pathway pseudopilin PulG